MEKNEKEVIYYSCSYCGRVGLKPLNKVKLAEHIPVENTTVDVKSGLVTKDMYICDICLSEFNN